MHRYVAYIYIDIYIYIIYKGYTMAWRLFNHVMLASKRACLLINLSAYGLVL